jgi:CBS domain-containing protein
MSGLVAAARAIDWGGPIGTPLSDAADARTRALVDGFVHSEGPPPARFAWVALGSHARRELHCASDQDHALVWETSAASATGYAADLAGTVIEGLERFGMRRCDGGYMADRWSRGLEDWLDILRERVAAPTPEAVVDADVFLDLRPLTAGLDVSAARAELARGADSPLLVHGLAVAANSFPAPLTAFGRLPKSGVDLKKSGLAPIVLLARLYGLYVRSPAVRTDRRLADAAAAGVLSEEITDRLRVAHRLLARLRLQNQLDQIDSRAPLSDVVVVDEIPEEEQAGLRDAFRAIRSVQSVTGVTFRTDL